MSVRNVSWRASKHTMEALCSRNSSKKNSIYIVTLPEFQYATFRSWNPWGTYIFIPEMIYLVLKCNNKAARSTVKNDKFSS